MCRPEEWAKNLAKVFTIMNKDFETLSYDEDAGVGVLTINRPKALNALNEQVFHDLLAAMEELRGKKLKGLILTGSGEKAFIAGADIKAMLDMTPEEASEFAGLGQKTSLEIENLPFPVIAAVNGFALGGGLEMALSCDFIMASENAVFGLPEVGLGLIPGFGGTQRLAKVVGRNRAKEMIFTARMVKVEEAKTMGLVLESFASKEELIDASKKKINKCAVNSIHAIGVAKLVVNEGVDLRNEEGLQIEQKRFGDIFNSYDMKEGTQAFIEKRKAEFKGE